MEHDGVTIAYRRTDPFAQFRLVDADVVCLLAEVDGHPAAQHIDLHGTRRIGGTDHRCVYRMRTRILPEQGTAYEHDCPMRVPTVVGFEPARPRVEQVESVISATGLAALLRGTPDSNLLRPPSRPSAGQFPPLAWPKVL